MSLTNSGIQKPFDEISYIFLHPFSTDEELKVKNEWPVSCTERSMKQGKYAFCTSVRSL
jgi:hypothetical protein